MQHCTEDQIFRMLRESGAFDDFVAHIEACPTCAERARAAMWKWVGADIHHRLPGTRENWDGEGCIPPSHIWWIGQERGQHPGQMRLEEPMHADHLARCPKCRWCMEVSRAYFAQCAQF